MRLVIYPLQLLYRDMGIDLGGGNARMAQLLLDVANIRSAIQHMGGGGMPEDMAGPSLADPGPPDITGHQVGQLVWRHGLAGTVQEQGVP